MEQPKRRYGLFTAITMIIGICIGSGIFFKSDNILVATGGSVPLGILVFVLGALSIIFGGLCISELASRTEKPGGIITYVEKFSGERNACCMGWFQIFVYYPALCTVVAWAAGIYLCILFGWPGNFALQMLIGVVLYSLSYLMNALSAKAGGWFQNAATLIKLIPLVVIAVAGIFLGDPSSGFEHLPPDTVHGLGWLAAVGPIAYSYDGWIISTCIAPEIRNSKKNLPKALVIAPIIVLAIYLLYFVGVASLVGPERVMAMQDAHVYEAAEKVFGVFGAKAILVFVVIAVMGTVNGIILGYIRLPYSMAIRGEAMFPFAKRLSVVNKRFQMPLNSALFCYALTLFWTAAHCVTVQFHLLPNSDVSEISIVMSYVFYIILYYKVFCLYRSGEVKGIWRGAIVPFLAALGSLFILLGGLQNILFLFYAGFCLAVVFLAFLYYQRKQAELHGSRLD